MTLTGEELPERFRRIVLGGVAVDLCHQDGLIDLIRTAMGGGAGEPLRIGSVNLDHVHHFGRGGRGELREVGAADDWVMTVDGMPIVWAARRATRNRYPRLAGSDLLPEILRLAETDGRRVGFVGGTESARAALALALARDYPKLHVSGHWVPDREVVMDPAASVVLAEQIRAVGTDLLVVGLGKPRQELWIGRHGDATGASVLLAFGASADFLAGMVRRAPDWVRDSGLEWFYRLVHEPARLGRRYLVQGPPAFGRMLLVDRNPARPAWLDVHNRVAPDLIDLTGGHALDAKPIAEAKPIVDLTPILEVTPDVDVTPVAGMTPVADIARVADAEPVDDMTAAS